MLSLVGSILTMTKSFMTPTCMKAIAYTATGCICAGLVYSTIKFIHDDLTDKPSKEEREEHDKKTRAENVEKTRAENVEKNKEKTEKAARAKANADVKVKHKQYMAKKSEAPEDTYEPEYNEDTVEV